MNDRLGGRLRLRVCGVEKGTRFSISLQFLPIPPEQSTRVPLVYLVEVFFEIQGQFVVLPLWRRYMIREWRHPPRGDVLDDDVLCLRAKPALDEERRRRARGCLRVENRILRIVYCRRTIDLVASLGPW